MPSPSSWSSSAGGRVGLNTGEIKYRRLILSMCQYPNFCVSSEFFFVGWKVNGKKIFGWKDEMGQVAKNLKAIETNEENNQEN